MLCIFCNFQYETPLAQTKKDKMKKKPVNMIGTGIAIGVAIGAAMGNVGLGIALGAALGSTMQKEDSSSGEK